MTGREINGRMIMKEYSKVLQLKTGLDLSIGTRLMINDIFSWLMAVYHQ